MIEYDDTNWPLIIAVAEETVTLADHRHFLDEWSRWLDRGQPFVLLQIFTSEAAAVRRVDASLGDIAWLRGNAERLRKYVLGIATAAPPQCFDELKNTNIAWSTGVPARAFPDGRSAVKWLREDVLAPAGMTVDL